MAFENVNVTSLKNSINNSINSIDYSNSLEVIDKISSNDVWNTASRNNLKKALKNLTGVKYPELQKKLEKFLLIADKIEEYQNLANANMENQTLLSSITADISEIDGSILNSEEVENINSKISENEIKMETIKNFISNNI